MSDGVPVLRALLQCAGNGRQGMLLEQLAHHRFMMGRADNRAIVEYIESDRYPTVERFLELCGAERAAKKVLFARLTSGEWTATAVWNGGRRREKITAGWWVGADLGEKLDTAIGHSSVLTGVRIQTAAIAESANPGKKARPDQSAVNAWLLQFYQAAHDAGRPPPKRDVEAFPACRNATGATVAQMKVAASWVKRDRAHLVRKKGGRDRPV